MKVLLATSLDGGGPLEHSLLLARHLSAAGVEVTASCADAAVAERFAATGARPEVLPLARTIDAAAGTRLERLAREHDVVHAQDRRCGLWTRIWPRRSGPARVYTVHGLPDPYLPLPGNSGRRPGLRATLAYRGLDAWLARRADAVVVPSRALATELVAKLGFPASRLEVIANGIDPAPSAELGPLVGTVSLLGPVKGLDAFVDAAAAIARARPEQRFAIFGEGPERAPLEARAAKLAAPVDFGGYVPMAAVLGRLRIFVLPSLFENAPMSLLEAMGAGVPCVVTAVGGVPELAGDAALSVPAGDAAALGAAIERLLGDPDLAADLGARGRDRVAAHFTAAGNAASMLKLYRRVLAAR